MRDFTGNDKENYQNIIQGICSDLSTAQSKIKDFVKTIDVNKQ